MKLRPRAPPANRPGKSSFLSRHCRVKVASSAWKHTSKLASSVDAVNVARLHAQIHTPVISTRIIVASDYGDSFRATLIGRNLFLSHKNFQRTVTSELTKNNGQRTLSAAAARSKYRSAPRSHDFPKPAYTRPGGRDRSKCDCSLIDP